MRYINLRLTYLLTHIMLILVRNTCMDANMQFTINSFRQLPRQDFFPDT